MSGSSDNMVSYIVDTDMGENSLELDFSSALTTYCLTFVFLEGLRLFLVAVLCLYSLELSEAVDLKKNTVFLQILGV